MIKSLAALAILGLLATAVVALPAPRVEAGETVALAKADRLEIRPPARSCADQVWPGFDAACLREGHSGAAVRDVRLVTAHR